MTRKVAETVDISSPELERICNKLAGKISIELIDRKYSFIYGVPRGGTYVAYYLSQKLGLKLIDKDEFENLSSHYILVVDDIVDSGRTRKKYHKYDFASLFIAEHTPPDGRPTYYAEIADCFIVFPWERERNETPAKDNILRLLQYLGEDIHREGLLKTPERYIKAMKELCKGYDENPETYITQFTEKHYDQMIILRDIPIFSLCEHHMLPFYGVAHVAYIPKPDKDGMGKIVGLSKLARMVETFARRLQVQERLCNQVTDTIMKHLDPLGAACQIKATHLCMVMRGVEKPGSVTVTNSLRGVFMDRPETRREFFGEINGGR